LLWRNNHEGCAAPRAPITDHAVAPNALIGTIGFSTI
jgi:hypothetical protein